MTAALERALADVCLAASVAPADLAALGGDARRWRAYRAMVRYRFADQLRTSLPRLLEALGRGRFDALVDAFLTEAPPRSRFLREVPGELVAFLEGLPEARRAALTLPAWSAELAHFNYLEGALSFAEDVPLPPHGAFDMTKPAVFAPVRKVLRSRFALHAIAAPPAGKPAAVEERPTALLLYRDATTGHVETMSLSLVMATILERADVPGTPLVDAVRDAAARHGAALDQAFVSGLSGVLADLLERGFLRGSITGA